jgi:hypothetical protein
VPAYTPPPVEPVHASLDLGDRRVDLATRALVLCVVPSPRWARESEVISGVVAAADAGADLVEVPADPRLLGPAARRADLPLATRVTTAPAARSASAAGAGLLLVPLANLDTVSPPAAVAAEPPERRPGDPPLAPMAVLTQTVAELRSARSRSPEDGDALRELPVAYNALHLTGTDLIAESSLAVSLGARILRVDDVRSGRRVVEVISSLLEARA